MRIEFDPALAGASSPCAACESERMRSLAIAWRNTMRKPRWTAVTVAAIALNTAVLIFIWAMFGAWPDYYYLETKLYF